MKLEREAENKLLGTMLVDEDAMEIAIDKIRPEDFSDTKSAAAFRAMAGLYDKGKTINVESVVDCLANPKSDAGTVLEPGSAMAWLADLSSQSGTSRDVKGWVKIIRDRSVLRELGVVADKIAEARNTGIGDVDSLIDDLESKIFSLSDRAHQSRFLDMKEISKEVFKGLEEADKNKGKPVGVESGVRQLDSLTSGWQRGHMVTIAGRTSMGKTAFAIHSAVKAALAQVPVAIFSLEMGAVELGERIFSYLGRVSNSRMRNGLVKEKEWVSITKASDEASRLPIYIDDTSSTNVREIRARARKGKREFGFGLIIVDYLQLVTSSRGDTRELEVSDISRNMKGMAKELKIPVMALSQLNRSVDMRSTKKPQLSDLRESGSIEQDSDLVIFVYRDEVYNRDTPDLGVAELIIGKHRNGPIGSVRTRFFPEFSRFEELAESERDVVNEAHYRR